MSSKLTRKRKRKVDSHHDNCKNSKRRSLSSDKEEFISNPDTQNIPENILEKCKSIKEVIPVKLFNCMLNELNSKKFLETYSRVTSDNKMSVEVNGWSNGHDEKIALQEHFKPFIAPSSFFEKQSNVQNKHLQSMLLSSNKYISNPFDTKSDVHEFSCDPFAYEISPSLDAYECENILKSSEVQPLNQKIKPFVPKNINIEDKNFFKILVNRCNEDGKFYPNAFPAMKNLEDCKEKLNNWKFEEKVKQVLTVKRTVNVFDVTFYDDDEIFVLDVKSPIHSHGEKMENFKLCSSDWSQELEKNTSEVLKKTRAFMEKKKHYIKKYQERRSRRWRNDLEQCPELPLSSDIIETFKLKKKLELPELTPEMNAVINEALMARYQGQVVSKTPNYTILYKDIETLIGLNWLNDEIINTYLDLIKNRSKQDNFPSVHVFNSFFYPKLKHSGYDTVKRWTRKNDIFSFDINLVPLHLGVHWCLAVIDHRYKRIQYYDSLKSREPCTGILRDYLVKEHQDKKKQAFNVSDWTLENMENIPEQNNGSDCGMFTLKYAEYVTRNAEINFTQDHMPYFRRKMVYEIVTGQLVL